EQLARAAHERALVLVRHDLLGVREAEPPHGVHLLVAVGEAAALVAHEEEAHALQDARRRAIRLAPREPVRHVAEPVLRDGLEPRLLADLADGCRLGRFAGLDVALRKAPDERTAFGAPPRDQDDGRVPAPPAVDEAARRELALERRPDRGRGHAPRVVASASHARYGAEPAATRSASTSGTS